MVLTVYGCGRWKRNGTSPAVPPGYSVPIRAIAAPAPADAPARGYTADTVAEPAGLGPDGRGVGSPSRPPLCTLCS